MSIGILAGISMLVSLGQIDAKQLAAALADRHTSYYALPMEYRADYHVAYFNPVTLKNPQGEQREFKAGETVTRSSTVVRRDGNRLYYGGNHFFWYDREMKEPSYEFVSHHDGNTFQLEYRQLNNKGKPYRPNGSVGPNPEALNKVRSYKLDAGGFLFGELMGESLRSILSNPDATLNLTPKRMQDGTGNELECVIGNTRHRILVDPNRAFSVVEWEITDEEKGHWLIDQLNYTELDGEYFPVAGQVTHLDPPQWTGKIALSEIVLHKEFVPADYEIKFPEKTKLLDLSNNTAYLVDADGTRKPLVEAPGMEPKNVAHDAVTELKGEVLGPATETEEQAQSTHSLVETDSAQSSSPTSLRRTIGIVLLAGGIATALTWAIVRRRGASE